MQEVVALYLKVLGLLYGRAAEETAPTFILNNFSLLSEVVGGLPLQVAAG